ncbi:MAG: hypothetical protein IKO26_08525 [Paludibacteraceae bacterium]|nr:hypothetical protein [Paludibacteraceae bacterium]
MLAGVLTLVLGEPIQSYRVDTFRTETYVNGAVVVSGCVLTVVGGIAAISGASIWGVGVGKKNNAYKPFNEHCAPKQTKPAVTLNLQASKNGIGLALNL